MTQKELQRAIITNNEIVQDDNVDVRLKPVYDN